VSYGFVHGNLALNNARPDGRWCGVNDEIRVLRDTGCYADFTYPSATSPTQPPTLNRIYRASSCPDHPRGHDRAVPYGALLMVQGPLLINVRARGRRLMPRLENGSLQASQPPTSDRLNLWLKARVRVAAWPDWYFVKPHAHGATERDRDTLLESTMTAFHQALARRAAEDPRFFVYYVTARELVNLILAAESGWRGSVAEARDFALLWGGGIGRHALRTVNNDLRVWEPQSSQRHHARRGWGVRWSVGAAPPLESQVIRRSRFQTIPTALVGTA
jgi:hypothetical protein